MDTRSQTLEALSEYVANQRALLARTQVDIEKLRKLRQEAVRHPEEFLGNETPLSFGLTDLSNCAPGIPNNIDWTLFTSLDSAPFRDLSQKTAHSHAINYPKAPAKTQQSALSPLQLFVKEARATFLDPVLNAVLDSSNAPSEIGLEDTVETEVGNDMLGVGRGGKKGVMRTVPSPARTRGSHGLRLPTTKAIAAAASSSRRPRRPTINIRHRSRASSPMETPIDTPATSLSFTPTPPPPPPTPHSLQTINGKAIRPRRASDKFSHRDLVQIQSKPRRKSSAVDYALMEPPPTPPKVIPERTHSPLMIRIKLGKRVRSPSPHAAPPEPPPPSESPGPSNKKKTKTETYKKSWSVSEQHLLERLLEEIGVGEKNRWQKISQAMQGKRTPRQVASRVQKYFEKLKKFGVELDDGNRAGGSGEGF